MPETSSISRTAENATAQIVPGAEEGNTEPPRRTSRKPSGLRMPIFFLSLLLFLASMAAYFWPVDRDHMILVAGLDGNYGAINTDGRIVVELKWDKMQPFDSKGMARVESDGKLGWIDTYGNIVISTTWDYAENFGRQNLARVRSGGLYGWIDRHGEVVVPTVWDSTSESFNHHNLIRVTKDSKIGWVNADGKVVIQPTFKESFPFDAEGLAAVQDFQTGKWGWINLRGELVITPEWDGLDTYDPHFIDLNEHIENRGSGRGVIDPFEGMVYNFEEAGVAYFDPGGLASVAAKGKWGCIDRAGKIVIEPKSEKSHRFDEHGMARHWESGKLGWIDRSGRQVIPQQWDSGTDFDSHGLAAVQRNNRWGWINREGEIVVEIIWENLHPFDDGGLAAVKHDGRWGWIDTKGEVVIPLRWHHVSDFNQWGVAVIKGTSKSGLINRNGEEILEQAWDDISHFDDMGMALALSEGKYGWINYQGELVIAPFLDMVAHISAYQPEERYSYPRGFDEHGMSEVRVNGDWGWINREGRTVIPFKYDSVNPFDKNNLARVLDYDKAAAVSSENLDSLLLIGLQGKYINRTGDTVLELPEGKEWIWMDPSPNLALPPNEEHPPVAYVASTQKLPISWLRKQYLRLAGWIDGSEVPTYEKGCVAFDPQGNLIWDNRWVRFETKCLMMAGLSLIIFLATCVSLIRSEFVGKPKE